MKVTPQPNILATNSAEVHHMLNIDSSVKRPVFYIIHGYYHKPLHERSFCTIGSTTDNIDLHAKLSTINMYLLLLQKFYSLQL